LNKSLANIINLNYEKILNTRDIFIFLKNLMTKIQISASKI